MTNTTNTTNDEQYPGYGWFSRPNPADPDDVFGNYYTACVYCDNTVHNYNSEELYSIIIKIRDHYRETSRVLQKWAHMMSDVEHRDVMYLVGLGLSIVKQNLPELEKRTNRTPKDIYTQVLHDLQEDLIPSLHPELDGANYLRAADRWVSQFDDLQ